MADLAPRASFRRAVLSPDCGLSASCRLLLLALAERQYRCAVRFPTQKEMAGDTGLSARTIRDLIVECHNQGWLDRGPDNAIILRTPEAISLGLVLYDEPQQEVVAVVGGMTITKLQSRAETKRLHEEAFKHAATIWFTYWRDRTGRAPSRPILDDDRLRAAIRILKSNDGDVSQGLYAIDGSQKDDLTMGRKGGGPRQDRFEVIFRDMGHVEKFCELTSFHPGMRHPYLDENPDA